MKSNWKIQQPSITERGFAIVMVMGFITMISFLIFAFSYESSVRRIQMDNLNKLEQAKLNAYAGGNFAMVLFDFYVKALDLVEKNSISIKEYDLENFLLSNPIAFPFPELANFNSMQKAAIKSFNEDLEMQGSFLVEFQTEEGGLNPNNLRETFENQDIQPNATESQNVQPDPLTRIQLRRDFFIKAITKKITDKKLEDAEFSENYRSINVEELVDELRYVVNKREIALQLGLGGFDSVYARNGVVAKHAPYSSISELYLLQFWDDQLIDLIKNDVNIRPNTSININRATKDELMTYFPSIVEMNIDLLLRYRDGDAAVGLVGHPFNNEAAFKQYLTESGMISIEEYDRQTAMLSAAGVTINTFSRYFKVLLTGMYEEVSYNMTLFVELTRELPATQNDTTENQIQKVPSQDQPLVAKPSGPMIPLVTEIIVN